MLIHLKDLLFRIVRGENPSQILDIPDIFEKSHLANGILNLLIMLKIHPLNYDENVIPSTINATNSQIENLDSAKVISIFERNFLSITNGKFDALWHDGYTLSLASFKMGNNHSSSDFVMVLPNEKFLFEDGKRILDIKTYFLVRDKTEIDSKVKNSTLIDIKDLDSMASKLRHHLEGFQNMELEPMVHHLHMI